MKAYYRYVIIIISAFYFIFYFNTKNVIAKRALPKEVEPIIYKGIKYTVPHFGEIDRNRQHGGYIEAWDVETNTLIWELKVYNVEYISGNERDIQDVFINSIAVKDGKLIVTNEQGGIYEVNPETKEVIIIKQPIAKFKLISKETSILINLAITLVLMSLLFAVYLLTKKYYIKTHNRDTSLTDSAN